MKWVSLFKAESSVHSLPFFSWWTLQFHKARKKKEGEETEGLWVCVCVENRSKEGRDCSEGGNAGKTTSGRAGISPFTGIWLVFPLCKNNKNKKTKSKKKDLQNGALKNKDDRGKGELLAGMWCWLLMCCWYFFFFFLFHKATLGFDAVVVIRGLAAATGFGLGALLDVCLRHTPPGGEVEGHTPCPRENPIPLNAVPLQLVKTQSRRLMCETDWVELDVSRVSVSSESSPVQF